MKPKISVVVPAYNAEKYIKKTIESILAQTFQDFEVVVIDDASTDNTENIIRELQNNNDKIKYFKNSVNKNSAASKNIGIEKSVGKYVAILDSDDIASPNRLEVQHEYMLKNSDAEMIFSSYNFIDEKGGLLGTFSKDMSNRDIIKTAWGIPELLESSCFFKRKNFISYREKFSLSEDLDRWLLYITEGKKMHVLSEVLVDYRISPESISVRKGGLQKYYIKQIFKFYKQRLKTKKDDYLKFNPGVFEKDFYLRNKKDNVNKNYELARCVNVYKFSHKGDELRKYVLNNLKTKEADFSQIYLFVVSFIPFRLVKNTKSLVARFLRGV